MTQTQAPGRTPAPAVLVLEDGRTFTGQAYGAIGTTVGEAVFSTGMSGYQETLTDPSYHRQVVVMTAPHIGNTGINDEDPESGRIWVAGYVVRDPARLPSNWRSRRTLDTELERYGVVGISGVDTRALTRHLRERGAMRAGIFSGEAAEQGFAMMHAAVLASPPMAGADLTSEVTTAEEYVVEAVGAQVATVLAVDLGIKTMTPVRLAERGMRVHVLPAGISPEDLVARAARGRRSGGRVLLQRPGRPGDGRPRGGAGAGAAGGAGPGLRDLLRQPDSRPGPRVRHVQARIRPPGDQPAGLRPGHGAGRDHGAQPRVRRRRTAGGRLRHRVRAGRGEPCVPQRRRGGGPEVPGRAAFSVQYHPEAAAGPHDSAYLFDRFADLMEA